MSKPVTNSLSQQYLEPLLTGDRNACRACIDQALNRGVSEYDLLVKLIWPTMELIQTLYREDRISQSTLNLATRLNRTLTDQLAAKLPRGASNGRKVTIFCGDDEPEELGGQLCADLFESDGWTVRFGGGGVPNDEVLKLIGEHRPDLLIMYGTLCCGGIYKRAEGLAEEIGADLYAPDAQAAVEVANDNPSKRASFEQQTVGRTRRIRKAQARKAASTPATRGTTAA
jgi:methanogenic corrinoid protein MtbC1